MNQVIILAGGKGKRMMGDYPKVLTKIGDKPMIFRLLESVKPICAMPTIVVGYGAEEVIERVGERAEYVFQSKQLGTGHAVLCAKEKLVGNNFENIIVLPGDHPLISTKTINDMIASHMSAKSVLTLSFVRVSEYEGIEEVFYNCGRIIRNKAGEIIDIVELKDADEEQKKIKEVNVSYYCFDAKWLCENIEKINDHNAANEFYLTDLVGIAVEQEEKVNGFWLENSAEGMGVNTPEQKKIIEDILKKQS